jgi:gluconokinase
MEAIALRLSLIYGAVEPLIDANHEVVLNGGAVLHSPVWMQIIADALRHAVTPLAPDEESSARGAALIAMANAGFITDLGAVLDPAEGCSPIAPISANAPAYQSARARQSMLESMFIPGGGIWTDLIESPSA